MGTARVDRLSPLAMMKRFAKQRSLTPSRARSVFRAEILAGRYRPRGIRFVWRRSGQPLLARRAASTVPGGWAYVVELDGACWAPALNPPDDEAIPAGFLLLATHEHGFDDAAATVTAQGTQYRCVTYLPEEAVAALPASTHQPTVDPYYQARRRRRTVVQRIKAAGKVPTAPDYPVRAFVEEVALACGLPLGTKIETVKGFNRRTLQRIFNSLKN
jgi:hypothetical protein